MKSKYICFVTPKAFATIDKEKFKDKDIDVIFTGDIYINMLDPNWTEEKCDNTAYIIEREYFEKNRFDNIIFSFGDKLSDTDGMSKSV